MISSLFAGMSAYALYPAFGKEPYLLASVLTFTAVALAEIIGGIRYLASSGKKTADQAIHGQQSAIKREQSTPPDRQ